MKNVDICLRVVCVTTSGRDFPPHRLSARLYAERWQAGGSQRQANTLPRGRHRGRLPLAVLGSGISQPEGDAAQAHDVPLPQQNFEAVSSSNRRSRFGGQEAPRTPGGAAGGQGARRVGGVTTRSAHPTQSGGGRAKPCRRVVLSGNTRPGRKPRRAHTDGVDREKAPRATNTSCVTGSLLVRVEGLEATLTPHPRIASVPLGPTENPPQTPSKDPRKTLLRHPQRTLGKPSPQGPRGP